VAVTIVLTTSIPTTFWTMDVRRVMMVVKQIVGASRLYCKRYSSEDHPAYVQRHWCRWAIWWQRQHAYLNRARTQVARWLDMWPNVRSSAELGCS